MSTQTLNGWITDQIKGILVGGVVAFIVLQVIYRVLRLYPDTWWLWAAGFLLLFSVVQTFGVQLVTKLRSNSKNRKPCSC
jgi:hypothetical protein